MNKLNHITRNDIPDDNTGMIINQLIDAVNKLQELARCAESSLVIDTKSIDSLLLQVSQQQEAIDDMQLEIARLKQSKLVEIDHIKSNKFEGDTTTKCKDCEWRKQLSTVQSWSADFPWDTSWCEKIMVDCSRCWGTGNDIDVPTTSSVNYGKTPTPHTITDTATDTNVGTKILYSKEKVEQEVEKLSRENDAYRAGIEFAVERYNTLYLENVQTVMDLYDYKEITNKRKKEMKSIYEK